MSHIKGVLRNHLRERPFDFYTAFVIFLAGAYAFFSPNWPEDAHVPPVQGIIMIVSAYMMVASLFVMSALLCNRKKRPIYAIFAEMWGWLAISAASAAVTIMYLAQLIQNGSEQLGVATILGLIWFGMAIASGIRSLDIYLVLRGRR